MEGKLEQATAPQFTNIFDPAQPAIQNEPGTTSPTTRDYSATDEWDTSKVPPSKFQKRKGSTFSTPPSRDGHVEKNADRDASFHKRHDTLVGKVKEAKDKTKDALGRGRKSSSGSGN